MKRNRHQVDGSRLRREAKLSAGVTLVELMIIVVIVGILSSLAIVGVSKYISAAKSAEATEVLASIRVQEELYKQETFSYLAVSTDWTDMHPAGTPGNHKIDFSDTSTTSAGAGFAQLGVETNGPVYFRYGVVAGNPGSQIPSPPTAKTKAEFGFPDPAPEPFYIAFAKGDLDGDGIFSYALTHSLTNETYVEKQGE